MCALTSDLCHASRGKRNQRLGFTLADCQSSVQSCREAVQGMA